jgi:hypothetical protein
MSTSILAKWLKPWFSNSGSAHRRSKAIQLVLERLEDRCVPAEFHWIGAVITNGQVSNDWFNPDNWNVMNAQNILIPTTQTPGPNDDVVISVVDVPQNGKQRKNIDVYLAEPNGAPTQVQSLAVLGGKDTGGTLITSSLVLQSSLKVQYMWISTPAPNMNGLGSVTIDGSGDLEVMGGTGMPNSLWSGGTITGHGKLLVDPSGVLQAYGGAGGQLEDFLGRQFINNGQA